MNFVLFSNPTTHDKPHDVTHFMLIAGLTVNLEYLYLRKCFCYAITADRNKVKLRKTQAKVIYSKLIKTMNIYFKHM